MTVADSVSSRKMGRRWGSTRRLEAAALVILADEQPMTIRQLFYRLVSRAAIANSRTAYQAVSRLLTRLREQGDCPWAWIVDRSRPTYASSAWADPTKYAEVVRRSYRKDYWQFQPRRVEIWLEKDAIVGAVEPVTAEFGVTVRVLRGFGSATMAQQIGKYLSDCWEDATQVQVFYAGDFDPSGVLIENDLRQRVMAYGHTEFAMSRIAVHRADIAAFNLPPLKIKDSDSRAAAFRRRHGDQCVELDALPPEELRRRVREAITSCVDAAAWKRAVAAEQAELASIVETCSRWPGAVARPLEVFP